MGIDSKAIKHGTKTRTPKHLATLWFDELQKNVFLFAECDLQKIICGSISLWKLQLQEGYYR